MRSLVPASELRQLDKRFGLVEAARPDPARGDAAQRSTRAAHRDGNARSPTPRERDVLRLLAAHQSRRQIATELGLSDQTVKTYLRDLYRKLDVNERADAVRVARRNGWL